MRSPRGFGRAVAAGGVSFARGVMLAPVRPAGKVTASLLRTTDRALQAMAMTSSGGGTAMASAAAAERSGGMLLKQGATGFGMGVLHGAVGLVQKPC